MRRSFKFQDNYPVAQCDRHLLEVELNERVHHNELEIVHLTSIYTYIKNLSIMILESETRIILSLFD